MSDSAPWSRMRSAGNSAARYGRAAASSAYRRFKSADFEIVAALLMDLAAAGILIGGGATGLGLVKKLEPKVPVSTLSGVVVQNPAGGAAKPKETPAEKHLKSLHAACIAAIIVGSVGALGGLAYFSTAQVNRAAVKKPQHQCSMAWMTAVLRLGMAGAAGALGGLGLDVIVEQNAAIEQMATADQKHAKSAQNFFSAALAATGAQLGGSAIAIGHASCHA